MTTNNVFEFFLSEKEKEKIFRTFCVKIHIFMCDGTRKRKYYCLECQRIYSRSGFHRHKIRLRLSRAKIRNLATNIFKHVKWHEAKVKYLLERKARGGKNKNNRPASTPLSFDPPRCSSSSGGETSSTKTCPEAG